jgi:hypothetical protein
MNRKLLLPGDELERAMEAGGISGGKQLFGIRLRTARTTQLFRHGQLKIENAVRGANRAVPATRRRNRRRI